MRVTDKILQNNFLSNLKFINERLYEKETRVLTNKKVNKPSDNPVDAMKSLSIRKRLTEIEQYQRNIFQAKMLMENTESVVNQLNEIFQRASTLTIQGASDSYGPSDRQSISYEINQLLEQVFVVANTRSESMYIFGGTYNDRQPYIAIRDAQEEITKVTTNGTNGNINRIIGENIQIKANVNGEELFEDGQNIFDVLIQIRDDLRMSDSDKIRENLFKVEDAALKISNNQSILGSYMNRVEAASSSAENDIITFTEYLSNIEDIDAARAIIDYQTVLLTLQSALQAGARILQPKLADFLK